MAYEVELKFWVDDPAAVRSKLAALGAKPVATQTETDMYFGHPSRSFAQTDEALRVRETGSRILLTYKGPKIDTTTKTRTEIEVELVPRPGLAIDLKQLLKHLGFRSVREVRKNREMLTVPWAGYEVHASLDEVPGLGTFVELEMSADPAQLAMFRQILAELARQLALSRTERRSYLELLLEKDAQPDDATAVSEDWSET